MEGLRGYWRRKKYVRLDGGRRRKSRVEIATLGSSERSGRHRFWRIKISPRLRLFRLRLPKRFFARIRDGYVNMMLGFANSRVFSGGFSYACDAPGSLGFGRRPSKEYEEKVIIEIYKSLVAQRRLVDREGGKFGELACQS